jgi:hypothetical protein
MVAPVHSSGVAAVRETAASHMGIVRLRRPCMCRSEVGIDVRDSPKMIECLREVGTARRRTEVVTSPYRSMY